MKMTKVKIETLDEALRREVKLGNMSEDDMLEILRDECYTEETRFDYNNR